MTRYATLASMILILSACGEAPSLELPEGYVLGTNPVDIPVVDPVDPVDPIEPPAPTYSVLKDWGWMGENMPIDFSDFQIGESMDWQPLFQYQAGFFLVNGRESRKCRYDVILEGTEQAGTLTVSNSQVVWGYNPAEAFGHLPCPTDNDPFSPQGVIDGVYTYSVDEEGLTLNGIFYEEVL